MELLKIVADKGVIALLLLLVGAYLGHRLERYKASNAYRQSLSAQKLRALEEVAELLGAHLALTQSFLHLVNTTISGVAAESEDAWKQIRAEYESLRLRYSADAPRLVACGLYLSPELVRAVTVHAQHFHAVFLAFSEVSPENLGRELKALMDSCFSIQEKLREEIARSPFDT